MDSPSRTVVIVIIGGVGSFLGSVIGALLVAFVQVFGTYYMPDFALAFMYLIMLTVLVVRPGGLLIMSTLNRTARSYLLGIIAAEYVLRWLPPSGYVPLLEDPVGNLKLMVLPTLTVGAAMSALVMRQTRTAMLQVLSQDFIRTARAKGVSEARIVLRHALRNALIPVVTVIA